MPTNYQLEQMVKQLEPFLERHDLVGYAAARNTRLLMSELTEFNEAREAAIREFGTEQEDKDGNPTGTITVDPGSEGFDKFAERMEQLLTVEHEYTPFKIAYSEVIGALSGSEILEIDWMLEDKE